MIDPAEFVSELVKNGYGLFCGVPDSLLKNLCAYLEDNLDKKSHIITANEGNAVALASGYHLATGRTGVVYLQNSGLGNIINPLASLADPDVYSIPMLLVVGWRGEPGVRDEPQHVKQGRITRELFDVLGIPCLIMGPDSDPAKDLVEICGKISERGAPGAVIIRKNTFSSCKRIKDRHEKASLLRESALETVLDSSRPDDIFISTTGKTSRELYELRLSRGEQQKDFLTVGSMGHTSSIALGVAIGQPGRRVFCLDGDGSLLMHMGSMAVIGDIGPGNLVHVLLNNSAHESVGGQPTAAGGIDFKNLALSLNYKCYHRAECENSIKEAMKKIEGEKGPVLLEICIRTGSRDDLSRPKNKPAENKRLFMDNCR